MEPRGRDQFEDLLDGALKQYGNVEPRPGLEGRVLARQELVAAEYVEQFPEEAKLILQEQQKFDEEVQKAQEQVENSRNSDNLER